MLASETTVVLEGDQHDFAGIRALVLDAAREVGFADRDAWGIVSAVFEAVANALHHGRKGGRGRIVVHIRAYADRFEAVVQDSGGGIAAPADSRMPGPASSRGRGIPLMKTFMDEVKFEFDGGCKVTLSKSLRKNAGRQDTG